MIEFTISLPALDASLRFEAENPKDAFTKIAEIQSTFSTTRCGLCDSPELRYTVRQVRGHTGVFDSFNVECLACEGKLNFGVRKDGGLFAKDWGKWDARAPSRASAS